MDSQFVSQLRETCKTWSIDTLDKSIEVAIEGGQDDLFDVLYAERESR